MKHEIAILLLWVIALLATVFVIRNRALMTLLGPLFAICMIGSISIVRRAKRQSLTGKD